MVKVLRNCEANSVTLLITTWILEHQQGTCCDFVRTLCTADSFIASRPVPSCGFIASERILHFYAFNLLRKPLCSRATHSSRPFLSHSPLHNSTHYGLLVSRVCIAATKLHFPPVKLIQGIPGIHILWSACGSNAGGKKAYVSTTPSQTHCTGLCGAVCKSTTQKAKLKEDHPGIHRLFGPGTPPGQTRRKVVKLFCNYPSVACITADRSALRCAIKLFSAEAPPPSWPVLPFPLIRIVSVFNTVRSGLVVWYLESNLR